GGGMQIILMHSRFTQAKSVTLSSKHLLIGAFAFLLMIMLCSAMMAALTLRLANADLPFLKGLVPVAAGGDARARSKDKYLKENLAAMAVKVGEMQAQLIRLDALGERVQGLAGVKPEEFNFKEPPPRGGAEQSTLYGPGKALGMSEFQSALDAMGKD